jgi:hypothetical protein
MQEYKVLKGFQHVTGYKNPGDMAPLTKEEAEKRITAGEIEKPVEMIGETIDGFEAPPDYMLDEKPKKRQKKSGEAGEG